MNKAFISFQLFVCISIFVGCGSSTDDMAAPTVQRIEIESSNGNRLDHLL